MKIKFVQLAMCFAIFSLHAQKTNYNLIVGTYTKNCDSKGIYVYDFDSKTANFKTKNVSEPIINPSYLTVANDNDFIYSVNENGDESTISAFSYFPKTGALQFLNKQASQGADPCHLINDDNNVIVANYSGGTIAVFDKRKDGSLTAAKQVIKHRGNSINTKRQEKPHAHMVHFSPDKKFVLSTNLGTDKIHVYKYNAAAVDKVLVESDSIAVKAGSGPRHLTFSKNGKFVYLLQELDGGLTVFAYANGKLVKIQETTILATDYKGAIGSADIHISPDGLFLYATNRGEANTITIFKLLKSGLVERTGISSTLGKGPRNFVIDPSGNYLLIANQYTNEIVIFKRDKTSGNLSDTGKRIALCAPVCLVFTKQ
jgi:6-phosphogluconolactonase